jgi:peptidoglycan/xylan/chitin deacetylase (PgdA/CDA1 family)
MNQLGRFWRTVQRVSRTHYPRFVFGLPQGAEIPVFTYHDVESESFAVDLEFLRTNGYRTLGLDEYLDVRMGKQKAAPRSVLLTFDDARKSFGTVALPLLRSFNARAVLFAPSYWMSPCADSDDLFMNWAELRDCLTCGLVDIESHAHRHALVAIAPQIVDFAHPDALQHFDIYDWPMRQMGEREELGRPALGTPIYRAAPLLSATRRYIEDEQATVACRDLVACSGNATFFRRPDWRRILLDTCRVHQGAASRGRWMPDAALRDLVRCELEQSRAEFKTHLGFAPRTIAYPWMLGSPASLELARDVGFTAAFGVALDFNAERRTDAALPVFARYKCDWLRFLPGTQRSSVLRSIRQKIAGFVDSQHLAH